MNYFDVEFLHKSFTILLNFYTKIFVVYNTYDLCSFIFIVLYKTTHDVATTQLQ